MKNVFVTTGSKQTQKLGEALAKEISGGKIICLEGELGSGKTTFAQGFLKGLKVKGPYTSPTFTIIKHYCKEIPNPKFQIPNKSKKLKSKIQNVYHIDAYRVNSDDILNLGWEEIISDKRNIIIIEWADKIQKIIPKNCLWIKFEWVDLPRRLASLELGRSGQAGENKRKLTFIQHTVEH